MKAQLKEYDDFDKGDQGLDVSSHDRIHETLKLVGAVDIGYSKDDSLKAVAYVLVMEYPSMEILYEDSESHPKLDFPYIPGFLAFKEIPLYQILFDRLKKNKPELWP